MNPRQPDVGRDSSPTRIAIAVVRCTNRFLVGQRPADRPLGGLWEFPGGKVEADETFAAAAVRECREETGLAVQPTRVLDERRHDYDHDQVHLRFIECRLAGELPERELPERELPERELPESALPEPKSPFCWVDRERLAELPFPAANESLLQQLVQPGRNGPDLEP